MDFFNHDSYSRALLSYYEDEGFAEVSPTIFLFMIFLLFSSKVPSSAKSMDSYPCY